MAKLFAQGANGAPSIPGETPAWFESLVERLKINKLLEYIGMTMSEALHIVYFFAGAFAIGFVFKKYFKFVIGCLIVITTLTIVLESREILTVDWAALKHLVGLDPANSDLNSLWSMLSEWIYANIYAFLGSVVGFALGYKLG